jgi:hypothetical protein
VARPANRPWLPEEARVVDRFVQALMRGEYESADGALPECYSALIQLWAHSRLNGRRLPARTRRAVLGRIIERAHAAGRPRRRVRLSAEEHRLVDRYARGLLAGRFESVADAARACLREHERVRLRLAVPPPLRRFNGIQQALGIAVRRLGAPPRIDRWTPAELRVVKRCARGVANGRYKRLIEAVRVCRAELTDRHTLNSTRARICRHAAELGWQGVFTPWTEEENRIAGRFAEAVNSGRYPRCAAATDDCLRALKAAGMRDRTRADVFQKLVRETLRRGRKLKCTRWNKKELAVLEPYARRLAAGEYRSGATASRDCRRALARAGFRSHSYFGVRLRVLRVARELGRQDVHLAWTDKEKAKIDRVARDYAAGKYPNIVAATEVAIRRLRDVRHGNPRKYSSVAPKVLARAHELGRPKYWRLWSGTENEISRSWLRWYIRYHDVRRMAPFKTASEGLQEDLEKTGNVRSIGACRYRLGKLYRFGHGAA